MSRVDVVHEDGSRTVGAAGCSEIWWEDYPPGHVPDSRFVVILREIIFWFAVLLMLGGVVAVAVVFP